MRDPWRRRASAVPANGNADQSRRNFLRSVAALAVAGMLPSCGERKEAFRTTDITGVTWGRDLHLVDHAGVPRSMSDFRGKVVMLFFGYTHCPDMCPTTLSKMAAAIERLDAEGSRVQGVFVTLDPARDTQELLAEYVSAFHPSFLGLRGREAEVADAARDFKVYFTRQAPDASGFYTVDHMAGMFIFDPQGRLRLYANNDVDADAVVHDLRRLLNE